MPRGGFLKLFLFLLFNDNRGHAQDLVHMGQISAVPISDSQFFEIFQGHSMLMKLELQHDSFYLYAMVYAWMIF